MNLPTRLLLAAFVLAMPVAARADTLTLRNGTVMNGTYLNSTGEALRFQTVTGSVETVAYAQILSLSTSATTPPAAMTAATYSVPAQPIEATIPAGTVLMVQMMDSVSSKSAPGSSFTTKLQYDLVANGVLAVRAGTIIYGKVQSATQAGRAFGRSTLDIRLTQMVANGIPVPLMTSSFAQEGESSGQKTALAAGAGAVIGNNTGGSGGSGAAWGAAIALLKPGQTLTIPPGSLLEFTLQQPVTVSVSR